MEKDKILTFIKVPSKVDFLFHELEKCVNFDLKTIFNEYLNIPFFYNLSFGDENFRRNYSIV